MNRPASPLTQPNDLRIRPQDVDKLRTVCGHYLNATRWAGWLGEPLPPGEPIESVRAIRRQRSLCLWIVGDEDV